jgi:hypothetical protein
MCSKSLRLMALMLVVALAVPAGAIVAFAQEGDWKSMENESKRMKIKETAQASFNEVMETNPKAKELWDQSYG